MRSVRTLSALVLTLAMTLAGCGGGGSVDSRDAPVPPQNATLQNPIGDTANFTPNTFLTFLNEHASLGAGAYELVVGTITNGDTGSLSVRFLFDDGSTVNRSGAWDATAGGGRDSPVHAGNPRFAVDLPTAGGLSISVDSTRDAVLFLLRDGQVLTRSDRLAGGGVEALELLPSRINSREFAEAYYNQVDPGAARTNLDGWKAANGFGGGGPGTVVNAVFRDAEDLGYGRDMYAWYRPGAGPDGHCGIAVYEDNYVVQLEPGDASTYGPLNLSAAIERDRRYLFGSNALEFGPLPGAGCTNPAQWVVTFYTFARPNPAGTQVRQLQVDFDGRGLKFMPGVCVICHGGTLQPPSGSEPMLSDLTLKSSTFSVLNPASLEFSPLAGFTFADQRTNIEAVNRFVREVFAYQDTRVDTVDDVANKSLTFPLEWLDGLMVAPVQQVSDFVPKGWAENAQLYKDVVEPYCLGCHATRGTQVGERTDSNAVNFSSFKKFISYKEETIDYVFRRGNMPLSLIGYTKFWKDSNATRLLADAVKLPDDFRVAPDGAPIEPGRAVARPGADRVVFVPQGGTRQLALDGSASDFSTGYSWTVVETPTGAKATLAAGNSAVARLTVDAPGKYRIRLVTTNKLGSSPPADIVLSFKTEIPDDRKRVFAAYGNQGPVVSISDRLGGQNEGRCKTCHDLEKSKTIAFEDIKGTVGVPVYLTEASYSPDRLRSFHTAVLDRVNFADPENSLLLTRPTATDRLRHGGGLRFDLLKDPPDPDYFVLLNWIRAGAPCGDDPEFCDFSR